MRILYLTCTSIYSGGERVTLDIAKHMQDKGNEVLYCGLEGDIRTAVENCGIPFLALPSFTVVAVIKAIRQYRPDIVHTMDFRASTYAAFASVPLIAHLHNNPLWLRGFGVNTWAALFFCFRAKRIVTVSSSVMKEFVFGNWFQRKTTVLGNVVDTAQVALSAAEPINPQELSGFDIGFIGRLTKQKQPLRFIAIFEELQKRMPAVNAVMIGDGELKAQVQSRIDEGELGKGIHMTGFLWNPFPILNRCRLVVMPSAWEGFGLTAVESMSLGKPVLASPVGGLTDIVTDECGKLCQTNGDFVSAIEELLQEKDLYQKKGKAAVCRAALFSDVKQYYSKCDEIYSVVLRETRMERFTQ